MRRRYLDGALESPVWRERHALSIARRPVSGSNSPRRWAGLSAPAPLHPDPRAWPDTGLHAAWLGHSTVLLKVDGTTILTDPVFSDRVGLNLGPLTLGLKRLIAPAAPLNRHSPGRSDRALARSHGSLRYPDPAALSRTPDVGRDRVPDLRSAAAAPLPGGSRAALGRAGARWAPPNSARSK